MADHAVDDDGNEDIFVYRGGIAPMHITRARIDESVEVITENAFFNCVQLVTVETHNRIRKIEAAAFFRCTALQGIDVKSVAEIGDYAFYGCENLKDVEFGDKLETVGKGAFLGCSVIEELKLPSITNVGNEAFRCCSHLQDVELSERLESINSLAFWFCRRLQRIAIPLKRGLFPVRDTFDSCDQLTRVDLVGEAHTKTIASLHKENWRVEIVAEIKRINQLLADAGMDGVNKTLVIRQWLDTVLDKMDHYKAQHVRYVKEGATLLELALWKAKLDEKLDNHEEGRAKRPKMDATSIRMERRVTCGADIVIKNVLPFLQLSLS